MFSFAQVDKITFRHLFGQTTRMLQTTEVIAMYRKLKCLEAQHLKRWKVIELSDLPMFMPKLWYKCYGVIPAQVQSHLICYKII